MTLVSWRKIEFELEADRKKLQNLASKAARFYEPFDIRKKSGNGIRHIDNPVGILKDVQRRIYRKLLREVLVPDNMIGGVARRSVRQNALAHIGQRTLVKLDLRNHFGRISNHQVFQAWRRELGASPDIAHTLTHLTTLQARLPQGAPTSSMLANLVVLPAHREISLLAEHVGFVYTLFVDDLTLSGNGVRSAIQPVIAILQKYGFAVSARKLRILDAHERQETTGIVVNRRPTVARNERERIRAEIMRLGALGSISSTERVSLWGSIRYATFIDPEQGAALAELADKQLPLVVSDGTVGNDEERLECPGSGFHRYVPAGVQVAARMNATPDAIL